MASPQALLDRCCARSWAALLPQGAAGQKQRKFSTYLNTINNSTLGFIQEKLLLAQGHRPPPPPQQAAEAAAAAALLATPTNVELHRNIFFNSNERSALRHIELTRQFVRLEFSEVNEEYRKHASLLFASDAERWSQGVPPWLVPVDLFNNSHCGAGGTILLDKDLVYRSLSNSNNSCCSTL